MSKQVFLSSSRNIISPQALWCEKAKLIITASRLKKE